MVKSVATDVIGVTQYFSDDSTYFFGCRGSGMRYQAFYKWLNSKSLLMDHLDWPWHYFTFQDIADEHVMVRLITDLDEIVSINLCWDPPDRSTMLDRAPYTPALIYH